MGDLMYEVGQLVFWRKEGRYEKRKGSNEGFNE